MAPITYNTRVLNGVFDNTEVVFSESESRPMSADKRPERAEDSESGAPPELDKEKLAKRTALFAFLVIVLAGTAIWFVATALRGTTERNGVTLSADTTYTVKVAELPSSQRETAAAMLNHPVVSRLTDGHERFLQNPEDDRIVVCAGRFETRRASEAHRLVKRLQDYDHEGKRPFRQASVIACSEQSHK